MSRRADQYDACVVGAGFAGIAASVALCRLGCRTVLVEKTAALGGVVHLGMHQQLCGLYSSGTKVPPRTLNAGIALEVGEGLLEREGSTVRRVGQVTVVQYNSYFLSEVLSDLVSATHDLELLFDSQVCAVNVRHQRIEGVELVRGQQTTAIATRAVIDCSAGDVVRLSGIPYDLAPAAERQLAAYAVEIENVDRSSSMLNIKVAYHLSRAVAAGEVDRILRYSVWLGEENRDVAILRISVRPSDVGYDLDAIREQAVSVHDLLRRRITELKRSVIRQMAPNVSEREGIRLIGEHQLRAADVLAARKFGDGETKAAWPIEFWDQNGGPAYHYVPADDYYEIPTGCLRSKDIPNLFAAGRCISADPRALASARVAGTCLAVGEQSARAAHAYLCSPSSWGTTPLQSTPNQ